MLDCLKHFQTGLSVPAFGTPLTECSGDGDAELMKEIGEIDRFPMSLLRWRSIVSISDCMFCMITLLHLNWGMGSRRGVKGGKLGGVW